MYFKEFDPEPFLIIGLLLFLSYLSGMGAYIIAIRRAGRPWKHILLIPLFLWLGSSLIVRMSFGTIKGLFTKGGKFITTPKFNLKKGDSKTEIHGTIIPIDRIFILEQAFHRNQPESSHEEIYSHQWVSYPVATSRRGTRQ